MDISDPFTNTATCVDRLHREWCKHGQLIVAVDFDDTVYGHASRHHRVQKVLQDCVKLNFHIVLFTAASSDRYHTMQNYLLDLGIEIASINRNPISLPYGHNGKPYYNILLDDRAGLACALDTLETVVGIVIKHRETN